MQSFAQTRDKIGWMATKVENQRIRFVWRRFEKRLEIEHARNLAFDRAHDTDTAEEVQLTDAGVSADQSLRGNAVYRPVWESHFHGALASLGIDFDGFTFVDVGSGKGKLLLLASDYPFAQIVAVEYAPGLHAVARRNIAVYRSSRQRCQTIESVLADALHYELPRGPIVCFMFNAMESAALKAWLERTDEDLGGRSEPAYLVYSNLRSIREAGDAFPVVRRLRYLKRTSKLLVLVNEAGIGEGGAISREPMSEALSGSTG